MTIDWEDDYNKLRTIHSIIKDLTREGFLGIPVWFGEHKKLPQKYGEILWKINDLLYDAEEIANKNCNN